MGQGRPVDLSDTPSQPTYLPHVGRPGPSPDPTGEEDVGKDEDDRDGPGRCQRRTPRPSPGRRCVRATGHKGRYGPGQTPGEESNNTLFYKPQRVEVSWFSSRQETTVSSITLSDQSGETPSQDWGPPDVTPARKTPFRR